VEREKRKTKPRSERRDDFLPTKKETEEEKKRDTISRERDLNDGEIGERRK